MLGFLLNRGATALLTIITVSILSFALLRLSGDLATALAGSEATPEQIEQTAALYGLDRPLPIQYLDWVGGLLRGDFGRSIFTSERVTQILAEALPVTLTIVILGTLLNVLISVPLGAFAAMRPNTLLDRGIVGFTVGTSAIPNFWLALLLMMIFSVTLQWTPVAGADTWRHYILPVVTLGLGNLAARTRLTRVNMIEALAADHIRTARAMGLTTRSIVFKHALRVALLPLVATTMVQLGNQLGRTVIIEAIFGISGLGGEVFRAILRQDFPVVQAIVLFIAFVYIVLTLVADLVNAKLDPRIRLT
jgi:ABC-type dipeptide/oligopeptide/nickel transport system permease component